MKIMLTLWNIKLCKYKLYPSNMGNYFYDMIPAGELSQVKYIPTIPEFLSWIEEKWADKPATSDTLNTYTYKEFCARIARKRALLNTLGLEKGDNVAIFERTSIDAIEMFLAAASAGYVGILLLTLTMRHPRAHARTRGSQPATSPSCAGPMCRES